MADHSVALRVLAFLVPVTLAGADPAQHLPPREPDARIADARPAVRVVFDGFVLEPDGAPAAGATVTSSAGGKAVTDASGRYLLEAEVPRAARSVELTAVSKTDTSHSASTRFDLDAVSGVAWVDPLQLVPAGACRSGWVPTFGGQPGVDETVRALTEFDAGSGPELYAGGDFSLAGTAGANHIARWNGSRWKALGSGVDASVRALAVYDDGSGPALYAGGDFTSAGGVAANHIAKWDGSSWSPLAGGISGSVNALAVFDGGSGPELVAGSSGGAPHIAKWDGVSWSLLNGGMNGAVLALTVFDVGGVDALYATGEFTMASGVFARRIAKWDGSSWSALGDGLDNRGRALAAGIVGGTKSLFVGGDFTSAGPVVSHIARWTGSSWSAPLGTGTNGMVQALNVYDAGGGPALYAGGSFTLAGSTSAKGIARWNGSSWSALGAGVDSSDVHALTPYDDGDGQTLVAGGSFLTAGTTPASRIGMWDGSTWSATGDTSRRLNGTVYAQTVHDDGSGPALYAGGDFTLAGSLAANRVARWDGTSWSVLGSGLNDSFALALASHDDGSGPALYAAGQFASAGGVPATNVARWNGTSWSALAGGFTNHGVYSLAVYDDGSGPALYAGGPFSILGGVAANHIAKWDGTSWSALGGGRPDKVNDMTVFDDGSGPALYAVSSATFGPSEIARWDGTGWTTVVSGVGYVLDLAVHDDGEGPALYVGGSFTSVGGVSANSIARWDGTSWSALGSGLVSWARALTAWDDGSGPALYAAGEFTTAGGVAANNIARWDGTNWSPLGSGLNGEGAFSLAVYDGGSGPALYVGGGATVAPDSRDGPMAKWGCALVNKGSKVRPR